MTTTPQPDRRGSLPLYIAAVSLVGCPLFVVLLIQAISAGRPERLGAFVMLSLLLIVSEQFPIGIQRRGGLDTVSLSGVFACALVLQWPVGWAIAVQVVASLIDDAICRRKWWKSLFNVGQYSISLAAAGLIVHVTGFGTTEMPSMISVGAAIAAGFTFFVVNNILPGIAMALASGERLVEFLLHDIAFQASVNGAMTVLAPVVISAADSSVWLVPLLLVPAVAVYRGARVSLEKEHRARHDHLTDLANRFAFTEAVIAAVNEAPREPFSVLVMDLDSFKELNDTLGHSAGDDLLRQIGPRLEAMLPADTTLARLGGDEFAILLPHGYHDAKATGVAREVLQALAEPFEVESTSLDLHASIGIACYPDHGKDPELLLQHADVAMYVAKRNRSGVEIYAADRNQHSRRRLAVLNELRPALSRGQLSVHYQPQVDMRTGKALGVEALVRWQHPELGNVSPAEFIGLAEHTGFIRAISDFVLAEAIKQSHRWRAAGIELTVAVNLSPQVLREPEAIGRILSTISDSGLPEGTIVVELTETALMADPDHSGERLSELAGKGIRLSIDDFGTGYSALSYLSKLPVSELKIDRSFVTHIDTHATNRHIVSAITDLARNLGITVVAEGIERVAEWQILAGLGCHVAQGFLVARAMPADEVTELLASGEPLIETFAVSFGVDPARDMTGADVRSAG